MIRKRDGPQPRQTAKGPGVDERAPSVPHPESLRKSRAHTTPPRHLRSRRRQDHSWRGFSVRLYLKPGSDASALYTLLKLAAQKFGLEVASVDEISDPK
jgi:hypothetical protein